MAYMPIRFRVTDFRSATLRVFCALILLVAASLSAMAKLVPENAITTKDDPEGVRIHLAPPKLGWRWADDATTIVFRHEAGSLTFLQPKDFPVFLKKGQYSIAAEGRTLLDKAFDADTELSLPPIGVPFLAYLDEDRMPVRGASLRLRSVEELNALIEGQRPLVPREFYGRTLIPIAREAADQAQVDRGLELARQSLSGLMDIYISAKTEGRKSDQLSARRKVHLLADILSEFGDASDVSAILAMLEPGSEYAFLVETAVRIEQRLGLLKDSQIRKAATAALETDLSSASTRRLITYLARTGDPDAMELLHEYRQRLLEDAKNSARATGLATLLHLGAGRVTDDYREHLSMLSDEVEKSLMNGEPLSRYAYSRSAWRSAGVGLSLLSNSSEPDDLALMDLPVPTHAQFNSIIPFVEDPVPVLLAYYGNDPAGDRRRLGHWSRDIGADVCYNLELRSQDKLENIIHKVQKRMPDIVKLSTTFDYDTAEEDRKKGFAAGLALVLDLATSHCRQSDFVSQHAARETAADEEARRFTKLDYDPKWWVRPHRAATELKEIDDPSEFNEAGFSAYSEEWIRAELPSDDIPDQNYREIFFLHHALLTNSFQSTNWYYGFDAERRIFRFRSGGGDGDITFLGTVDIVPVIQHDQLLIAVQSNINWFERTGTFFSAMHDKTRDQYRDNYRLSMFDRVSIEKDGVVSEATYERTLPDGVHLFSVPYSGDLSNTYLRIGMEFHIAMWEETLQWSLDYALHSSRVAFNERLSGR